VRLGLGQEKLERSKESPKIVNRTPGRDEVLYNPTSAYVGGPMKLVPFLWQWALQAAAHVSRPPKIGIGWKSSIGYSSGMFATHRLFLALLNVLSSFMSSPTPTATSRLIKDQKQQQQSILSTAQPEMAGTATPCLRHAMPSSFTPTARSIHYTSYCCHTSPR